MVLSAGQRIGHYEIVSAIGAGGMGEVYRAHDAKLKRDVALKILPTNVSGDLERLTGGGGGLLNLHPKLRVRTHLWQKFDQKHRDCKS